MNIFTRLAYNISMIRGCIIEYNNRREAHRKFMHYTSQRMVNSKYVIIDSIYVPAYVYV